MSVCPSSCTAAKCLAAPNNCAEEQLLTIGTMPDADTDYTVYIRDNNTTQVRAMDATSDGDGILQIDLSAQTPLWFHPNSTFTLWVTAKDADISATEEITIGEDQYTCFDLRFERMFVNGHALGALPEQTITV